MSERFWQRNLRHLNGHAAASSSGVQVVQGKNGPVYKLGGNFDFSGPAQKPSEATQRANLLAELAAQKRARQGNP